jgi:general nucleoside transport system permease protein
LADQFDPQEENGKPQEDKGAPKPGAGQIFLEEVTHPPEKHGSSWFSRIALIPLLAVLTGLIFGALFIIFTTPAVYDAFEVSFGQGIATAWDTVRVAYTALFNGSIGNPAQMVRALQSGDDLAIRRAFNPFLESLVTSTPYIFAGLAVALGFRAGVFNIGAEGQIFIGALTGTFIGYSITGLPAVIHIPLALLAGFLGGAIWGFIPGWLKAKTGGHEVINTIMMNYIAFRFSEFLMRDRPNANAPAPSTRSARCIERSAWLPRLFGLIPSRIHLGFFVALLSCLPGVLFCCSRLPWGFDLRTVGANPNAAKYAGMKVLVAISCWQWRWPAGWQAWPASNEVAGCQPQPGEWLSHPVTASTALPWRSWARTTQLEWCWLRILFGTLAQRCDPHAGRRWHPD